MFFLSFFYLLGLNYFLSPFYLIFFLTTNLSILYFLGLF